MTYWWLASDIFYVIVVVLLVIVIYKIFMESTDKHRGIPRNS